MNKAKLKEILDNSKDAFRVYRDEYGNVWQIIPQEEYMELTHTPTQEELSKLVKEYLELRTILLDWNGLQSHKQEDLDKYRILEKTIKEMVGIK